MKYLIKLLYILFFIPNIGSFLFPPSPNLANLNHNLAVSIVKTSTSLLPHFDSVSHFVLSTNEILINKVLDINIDPLLRKKIILNIIDLTRQGDEMGSKILENYYKLIDYIL